MSEKENSLDLNDFVTENKLLEWLNIKSKQLASLRQRGFPYVQVANNVRVYHRESVAKWFLARQKP